MRQRLIPSLSVAALALASASASAQTMVSGPVSGIWPLAGSPYQLVGDTWVSPGQSLLVQPGVEVVGMGLFALQVQPGALLQAEGSAALPILFTAQDSATGWRGLRFDSASDDSVLRHCVVEFAKGTGAFPDVRGGAVWVFACSPTIERCELRFSSSHNGNFNGTGGGLHLESSDAVVRENHVHDNTADSGAGICVAEYGTPLLEGNRVEDNDATYAGGGMYFGARSSPLVRGNRILRNHSAGWGGGGINSWTSYVFYGTSATVENNLILENTTSTAGGGVYCRYDRCLLTNNTIAFNDAAQGGGVFVLNQGGSAPLVRSCVVWGNTAPAGAQVQLEASTGSALSIAWSDVQGGWVGAGNLDADPLFVASPDGDHYLSQVAAGQPVDSPCVDAGDPSGALIAGTTRTDGDADAGVIDMGFHYPLPTEPGVATCFGDPGSGTPCPCANDNDGSAPGSGCANGSFPSGAQLAGDGKASVGADTLVLSVARATPNESALFFQGDNDLSPGLPFGDGLRCAGGDVRRLEILTLDPGGNATTAVAIGAAAGNVSAGDTKTYQCWYRDPLGSPCGQGFNFSNAYRVTWGP